MKPNVSIIIPAYNEEDRLDGTLRQVIDYMSSLSISYEIIVVDDGSTDSTPQIAANNSEVRVVIQEKNLGKGAAVRRGMLEAEGKIRIFSDADLSTPIYEIDKLLNSINDGYQVAIGSRAVDYSMIKEHQPFYREFMGKTFNRIVQFIVLKGIKDTQCGFKGFTDSAAEMIFREAKIDGFGFDVEILWLARKFGFRINEIPVEWYNDSRSRVDPIKDSIKMLIDVLKIKKLHGRKN